MDLPRLHSMCRYRPQRIIEVELNPLRLNQLAYTHEREREELKRQFGLHPTAVVVYGTKELRYVLGVEMGVVARGRALDQADKLASRVLSCSTVEDCMVEHLGDCPSRV